jgi:shikimate kinase
MSDAPIFLTGFSGAGKTTIGHALAFKLGRIFFDLDSEIELLGGAKVATIIAQQGEERFRSLESQILNSLSMTKNSVIALGGGALISRLNVKKVKERGCLIYLESSVERLLANLQTSAQKRPLINESTPEEIERMLEIRRHGYLSSHVTIHMDQRDIQDACHAVESGYKKWLARAQN